LIVCGAVTALLSAAAAVCAAFADFDIRIVYAAAALALISAVLGAAAAVLYKKAGKNDEAELEMLRNTALVSFDKASERASVSGAFTGLTGIETGSKIIGKDKYGSVMSDICSSRHPTEKNVYMSSAADKWIKAVTNDADGFEFTEITDVTDYIVAKKHHKQPAEF